MTTRGATPAGTPIEVRFEQRDEIGIGVVAPFDFALDRELWDCVPPHVTLYLTRTPAVAMPVDVTFAEEVGDPDVVARAVADLAACEPAVTVYACTSGSFVGGVAGEAALRTAMEAAAGRPALTTSGALVEALRACNARRVAVATPYTAALSDRLVTFLAEAGFTPAGVADLGLTGAIPAVSTATVTDLVLAASGFDADAIFVSCTNLRTLHVLPDLEQRVGRPVISANQVTMWSALRLARALSDPPDPRLFGAALSRA